MRANNVTATKTKKRPPRCNGNGLRQKTTLSVDVASIYPYAKCFDTREENGRLFKCYLVYKQTHLMDSKEMARLIDGAIEVAREFGIETDTPEQIARYKELWRNENV